MSRDVVWHLRRRLLALYHWFREDMNRLGDAQEVWRSDALWHERRQRDVLRLQDDHAVSEVLPASPARALLELEAIDRALWLTVPDLGQPRIVGDGAQARYIVRLARRREPLAAHQVGLLSTHLRYHAIIPPSVTATGGATFPVRFESWRSRRCTEAVKEGAVTVGTTSFGDGAPIEWGPSDGCARSVATADARVMTLGAAVREAAAAGAHLLIAPELTLPPAQRDRLLSELRRAGRGEPRLALAVLGSFHETRRDRHGVERTYNVAMLVDGVGNRVFEHRKLAPYGAHGSEGAGAAEAIGIGHEIRLVVSPIGIIAIAICKDLCDVHVGAIWRELQPEWLLVPAYGSGESAHQRAARDLALVAGTVTVVAHEALHSVAASQGSFVHDRARFDTHARAPAFKAHTVPFSVGFSELDGAPTRN